MSGTDYNYDEQVGLIVANNNEHADGSRGNSSPTSSSQSPVSLLYQ